MADLMNHVRNCIRTEVKQCLMGCKYYTPVCGSVENYLTDKYLGSNRGVVNVRLGSEAVEKRQSGTIGKTNKGVNVHKLQVILEVIALGCDDVEYFVDSLCAEAQKKMCECVQEGGACHSIEYQGTEPDTDKFGEKTLHLCRIYYELTYIADGKNMSQYQPVGCT